jgi:hypothetical protein
MLASSAIASLASDRKFIDPFGLLSKRLSLFRLARIRRDSELMLNPWRAIALRTSPANSALAAARERRSTRVVRERARVFIRLS